MNISKTWSRGKSLITYQSFSEVSRRGSFFSDVQSRCDLSGFSWSISVFFTKCFFHLCTSIFLISVRPSFTVGLSGLQRRLLQLLLGRGNVTWWRYGVRGPPGQTFTHYLEKKSTRVCVCRSQTFCPKYLDANTFKGLRKSCLLLRLEQTVY